MTRHTPIPPSTNPPTGRQSSAGRALVLGMLGLAAVAGCVKTTAADPGNLLGIAGTYRLVQVNSSPLPFDKGNTFVVRGQAVIHGSPRFEITETDSTAGSTTQVTTAGGWSIANNALTFVADDGGLYLGALTGSQDTLRIQFDAYLQTYVKQ